METIEVKKTFEEELKNLLNLYSKENSCNTPDFILAQYLEFCLRAFTVAVNRRDKWWGDDKRHFSTSIKEPSGDNQPRGADDQLTQCMPAELRIKTETTPPFLSQDQIEDMPPGRIEPLPVPEDDNPPGVPWTGGLTSYKGVEGHEPECEIDLYVNWKPCTCGRG